MFETNKIYHGECKDVMSKFPDNCIDLTVTSPPYDNLRSYNGYSFDFEGIAQQLFRVTKKGGVVVWVVGDATINGSETGTSFRQALYFMSLGFNLHDTMIYEKKTPIPLNEKHKYQQCFEYMFVFSKGSPQKGSTIQVPTKTPGKTYRVKRDNKTSGGGGAINTKDKFYTMKDTKNKKNIWEFLPCGGKEYKNHPAAFPERLANDHILSWSDKGDCVLDPFCGSGTTIKMAIENHREYIGIEISEEYIPIIKQRLLTSEPSLF